MPYLGNPPAERFTSFDYQDLTGGSGTSFTLDNPVGNPQEIEVFVNNVRQEPGVAYTVSGTALTMTGSIASTDDFYVVFQGKAIQTATHPSDRALTATDGTFTGDLTVDTNTLHVDAANNLVGVGTASPAFGSGSGLEIEKSDTATLRVERTGSTASAGEFFAGNDKVVIGSTSNTHLQFRTNGSEVGRFLSGGGLTFNGDTAAANALDDYEEGTWTPALSGPTTVAYSSQIGRYTKIGRMVWLSFTVTFSTAPTGGSNYRFIIPFTPEGSISNMYGGDVFIDTALVTSNYGHFLGVYNGSVNVYVATSAGSARSGSSAWQTGTLSGHIFINTST